MAGTVDLSLDELTPLVRFDDALRSSLDASPDAPFSLVLQMPSRLNGSTQTFLDGATQPARGSGFSVSLTRLSEDELEITFSPSSQH